MCSPAHENSIYHQKSTRIYENALNSCIMKIPFLFIWWRISIILSTAGVSLDFTMCKCACIFEGNQLYWIDALCCWVVSSFKNSSLNVKFYQLRERWVFRKYWFLTAVRGWVIFGKAEETCYSSRKENQSPPYTSHATYTITSNKIVAFFV